MTQFKPLRRSKLVTPFGVGAIVNFPNSESLMTCGLDVWPFALEDCPSEMRITEERLQQRLGVDHFRFPPEFKEKGAGVENPFLKIPFVRFPRWHYCPRCGAMEQLSIYGLKQSCKGPKLAQMSCESLSVKRRPTLIPVRFICVCEQGHIEDFPFMEWVHREQPIQANCQLRLRAGRSASSLSGITVNCTCGAWKTMAGAFNKHSLQKITDCSGQRPWLGEIGKRAKHCGNELRVVQRGASNVYFPTIRSSIYLPKWSQQEDRKLIDIWESNREGLIRTRVDGQLNRSVFEFVASKYKVAVEKLLEVAQKALDAEAAIVSDITEVEDGETEERYRKAEYDAILSGSGGDNQEFSVVLKDIEDYGEIIQSYFKRICLLHKLRETRALVGFSRLLPEDGRTLRQKKADMALSKQINWLPAIVVKGEGIFFEFDEIHLDTWLRNKEVSNRTSKLIYSLNQSRLRRGLPIVERNKNFSRFILLHTFAHILINQFSFECGYGSSALRERIYCNIETDQSMNGILIYTASGDSEGSLGGLVRQGNPGYLENIVASALYSAQWCSSDPVCMESQGQGPDSCNLAACHSCCLLPETSCEHGNRVLDRALVVGSLESPESGYFSGFDNVLEQ